MFDAAFAHLKPFRPQDLEGAPLLHTPSSGIYLREHVAKSFDETLTGRVLEEGDILDAEKAEGTYDPNFLSQQEARDMFGTFPNMPPVRHAHAMSEADWKSSPFYRKEIIYRPDMTSTRARIMAENFDERRYRDALIANGDEIYGLGMKALSFGATLVGSLPDPVNLLPLGGGMNAAAQAGKAGIRAAAKAGAKAGVVEGAAGAALSDAIVFPDLRARGEDLGFVDFLLDTAFGGALGAGLGVLGGGLHGYMGKRRAEAQALLAERALFRHAELLRKTDARKKERLAVEVEFGALDNNFLNSGWHAFEDNPDDFFLTRAGKEGGPGRPLITQAETFLGLIDDADADIAQSQRWRDWTFEFRNQLKEAGFHEQDAEGISELLGAHAEVMAPMFGMEPGAWLERRLAGFRSMNQEEFNAARAAFLYDASEHEAAELRRIKSEWRRTSNAKSERIVRLDEYSDDIPMIDKVNQKISSISGKNIEKLHIHDIQSIVNGFNAKNASQTNIVQSEIDLPENLQRYGKNAVAMYDPPTNTVWIIADKINGPEHLAQVWAHEQIVHHGLRGLYDVKERAALMDDLWGKIGGAENSVAREVAKKYGFDIGTDQGRRLVMEETLAYLAEKRQGGQSLTKQEAGLWQKIVEALRHAFNALVGRTDADALLKTEDIDALLSRLGRYVLDGEKSIEGDGRVLFQPGDTAGARGAITFRPEDGQALISLFKGKADISTVIHEGAGHFFLENLHEAARLPNAPAWVRDGWRDVAKAIGADIDPAKTIGTEAHEKFARMAVDYFRRGEAPSIALISVFQRFARWLTSIYRALTRRGDFEDIAPEVKRVMDHLLVAEDQLRAREINLRVIRTRNDEADLLRAGLPGREKRDVMRAQEKALADMAAGQPVDVGPILRDSPVMQKTRALQREFTDSEARDTSDRTTPEPDYTVERQDDFPPAPEVKNDKDAEMADMEAEAAVDADIEARLADLEAQGKLDSEDAALLAETADQATRAERYGELGQSVLECVMEVVE